MPSDIIEISNSSPLARVEHSCIICGTPIAIGTKYLRHVVRDTNAIDPRRSLRIFKYHLACPHAEVTS